VTDAVPLAADLAELFGLPPVQRAALALLLASVGLPVIGVIIVGLDIMPVRFAMMHTALLGIAVGLLLGIDPLVCALIACALAGASVAPLARTPQGLSGAMGLLMSLAVAAALLILAVSGVNASGAFALLWGSVLSVGTPDLVVLGSLAVVVPALMYHYRRPIALLLHDRELAECSGVPVRALTLVLLVLVAVAVAGAIKLTGALLVDALTLLPALAARRLGTSLKSITLWAVGIGVVVNLTGFLIALRLDWPPGPVLVLTAGAAVLAVHLVPERRISTWHAAAATAPEPTAEARPANGPGGETEPSSGATGTPGALTKTRPRPAPAPVPVPAAARPARSSPAGRTAPPTAPPSGPGGSAGP
jgi:zinc transport system permease protein